MLHRSIHPRPFHRGATVAAMCLIGALALPAASSAAALALQSQSTESRQAPPAGDKPAQQELPAGHPPLGGLPAGHPPIDGMPAGHPAIGNERSPGAASPGRVVPANPDDVRSTDALVSAYYGALSGAAGEERNWDRFRSLFIPEARLISAQPLAEAQPCAVMTPEQFIQMNGAYFKSSGYFETDINRRTEIFGNTASIFSTYESRKAADGEVYSRGINSMQLVFDGKRWWIATVLWDFERPDTPIPAEYLPSSPPQDQQ